MYLVIKPVKIGGKNRHEGDIISSSEYVSPWLVRSGYVKKVTGAIVHGGESGDGQTTEVIEEHSGVILVELPVLTDLPVISESGATSISVGCESIAEAVRVLQLKQAEALEAISASLDTDMLLVLEITSSVKAIKSAAAARVEALTKEAGEA
jgi:hypothetical protein